MLMLIVLAATTLVLSCLLVYRYLDNVRVMDARDALKCEVQLLKAERAKLTELLHAERAVTAGYDKSLDEAMELLASQRKALGKAEAFGIAFLEATEPMPDLNGLWSRGQQRGFIGN